MKGFEKLTRQVAQFCKGVPLALKVLGSSLYVSDEYSHKRNSMIENLIGRMNSLHSLKEDFDSGILGVLRKSLDSGFAGHKELFIDIACFFVGENKDMITIVGDDLYAKYGIATLVNRGLLTVSRETGELKMHQMLQEVGRRGSHEITGLALNMLKVKDQMGWEELETSSVAKMNNLKFLKLNLVKFTGSYENFPKVRFLSWHGCPLQSMPSGLLMSSLVALDMRYGDMEIFEAPTVLHSLKILNLKGCEKLKRLSSLHRFPKLETLMLQDCIQLCHLCKSIRYLTRLSNLYLTECIDIWMASSDKGDQSLLYLPKSLIVLDLSCCDLGYNNDDHVEFHAKSLFNLFLSHNPFEYLPGKIDLKMLRVLYLLSCPKLKSLPCMPSTLVELYVDGCTSLERITFESTRFSLEKFSYEGCSNLSEVQGLFKLVPIANIDNTHLVQHMQWIKEYEEHEVELVGDEITKGIYRKIQVLSRNFSQMHFIRAHT
ncbi:disease resistance protein RML1A-like [Bidens hawaiensis]|uniref:disease resistance protein RML1A-like n=1 Tax=Bidens hawaiensis TaxID=980011 RepID=UPI00404920A8